MSFVLRWRKKGYREAAKGKWVVNKFIRKSRERRSEEP